METADIAHVWGNLGALFQWEIYRLRGAGVPQHLERRQIDQYLVTLPLRLGGIGITSYRALTPLAMAASIAESETELSALNHETCPSSDYQSQKESSREHHPSLQQRLVERLSPNERILHTEIQSVLGRRWLTTQPSHVFLRLTDWEVASGLRTRTMWAQGDDGQVCRTCGAKMA